MLTQVNIDKIENATVRSEYEDRSYSTPRCRLLVTTRSKVQLRFDHSYLVRLPKYQAKMSLAIGVE